MTKQPSVTTRKAPWTGRPSFRRDVQGLRAVAVLAVMAFHAGLPVPGGFTGVDVFFVISGYVITELILRRVGNSEFSFRSFYARRAQRLLPALALMTALVFLVSLLLQSPFGAQQQTAWTGIGAMLLAANVVIVRQVGDYFSSGAEQNPLLNTWSLSVEEQFYLVFPFILVASLYLATRRSRMGSSSHVRVAMWSVAAVTVASFILGALWTWDVGVLTPTSQPSAWAFYLSPARAWEFGVGALLALWLSSSARRPSEGVNRIVVFTGALGIFLGFLTISESTPFPGFAALLPVLGTALIIFGGSSSAQATRVFASGPMVRIGNWSYSLYLWHWPFIVFALLIWSGWWVAPIAALASVFPALASYYWVENPIRRANWLIRKAFGFAAGVVAVVVAAGLLLLTVGSRSSPAVAGLEAEREQPTVTEAAGCFLPLHFDPVEDVERLNDDCWFSTRSRLSNEWVLLAGDSHASHASTAVIEAANSRGLSVFSVTGGACPFQPTPVDYSDLDNCDQLNEFIWQQVDSNDPPSAVVLASKGVPSGAGVTIERLENAGISVIWLLDVPRWSPEDQGLQYLPCRGGLLTFECTFDQAEVDSNQALTRAAEWDLMARYSDVVFVDTTEDFCTDGVCSPVQDNRLMYRDNEHLNNSGSQSIRHRFEDAFETVGIYSS